MSTGSLVNARSSFEVTGEIRSGDAWIGATTTSDGEFDVGLVFYDAGGEQLYQEYRSFETSTDHHAFTVSGAACSSEF